MAKKPTIFQRINSMFSGNGAIVNNYNVLRANPDDIIVKTKDKDEYDTAVLQARQQHLLARQWKRAQYDITNRSLASLNEIKLMYREADLMDLFPEIGTALDIITEECNYINDSGCVINITSNSERVKAILQDLFVNRLSVNTMLPMICRCMCKYGNDFLLLNIDDKNGITGWKELPVYEIERYENGMENPYASAYTQLSNVNPYMQNSTKFVWVGTNEYIPYQDWQIAHFRLLYNSIFLPYGCSFLQKARRHFRLLSMMEDSMLLYRLERSVERRVFKINVGAIDEQDVPAYVQQIANEFKRTPIIDPMTGQIDLRKNVLPVWKKTPIPLLDGRTITIEELAKEYENGKINYVYSIQDNSLQIVPGKVVWCGKNYTPTTMVKITLDDNSYMVMAPEHEIIMRDGTKKRADKVQEGESVMPFYREYNPNSLKRMERYEKIYNPNSGKYEYTHRLIAKNIKKENEKYNTVHHKDFNKYNNCPDNLLWCDFHEHHKMHSEVGKNNWKDEQKRQNTIKKLSESTKKRFQEHPMTQDVKNKISSSLKKTFADPKYREFFQKNGQYLVNYNRSEEGRNKTIECNKKRQSYLAMQPYNHSELHKQHDEIRRRNKIDFWKNGNIEQAKRRMTVIFDDYMWNKIREAILHKIIYNRCSMLEYINTYLIEHLLEINTNKRLHKLGKISREVLETRIHEIGFNTITEYIDSIKKNHKIKSIEYINGDDVYCMTVVGLNREEDRHNFALRTFTENDEWNDSGCFVSNCNTEDFFIPVRSDDAPNPIETLPAAQNLNAIDDIKFIQNKVFTALRVPKSFLNFEEAQGDGKNLSLLDVRFSKTVNRIQQALIMELNKVAIVHLILLGLTDELTNFTITMNNPSSQAEMLEIENLAKKITTAKDAITDGGNGIPLMSVTRAWKTILKWSDKEIADNLEELRLENALAGELKKTFQIIKRTGIFDPVDNVYGEAGAEYSDTPEEGADDGGVMGGGGSSAGAAIGGGDVDFGEEDMGGEEMDNGQEGEMDIENAANEDGGGIEGGQPEQANENLGSRYMKKLLTETLQKQKKISLDLQRREKHYAELLKKKINEEKIEKEKKDNVERIPLLNKNFLINEELDSLQKQLNEFTKKKD